MKENSMRKLLSIMVMVVIAASVCTIASADSIMTGMDTDILYAEFPDMADKSAVGENIEAETLSNEEAAAELAIWPFGSDDEEETGELKPKSTRKAFFLSLLLPGLGETYVGSKRGIFFFAVEALSWWMYTTNTNEGNDLEKDFRNFADNHWHYTSTTASDGSELDHNYWKWLQYQFRQVNKPDDIDPYDYKLVNEQLEATVENSNSPIFGHSVHSLPSTKTQQYYEMIGKYPQFVYGWEDVGNTEINPTIRDNEDNINYGLRIEDVKSPMRVKYEDMRDDSNQKLKAGQRGIHIMLISRVVSAIHAGRLAYKHNQRIRSEISTIDVDIVDKYVIDNRVPMLMFTKKF